jgi:hypothetical protein
MANEVEVHELTGLRGQRPVAPFPAVAKQTLSIGGAASSAFNRGTVMVRITTTTTCRVEFGSAPAGSGNTVLIYSGLHNDFDVIAGQKVIAVAA